MAAVQPAGGSAAFGRAKVPPGEEREEACGDFEAAEPLEASRPPRALPPPVAAAGCSVGCRPPTASAPARPVAGLAPQVPAPLARSNSWSGSFRRAVVTEEERVVLEATSDLLLYSSSRDYSRPPQSTILASALEPQPEGGFAEVLAAYKRPKLTRAKLAMVALLNLVDCINMNLLTPYAAEMVSELVHQPLHSPEVLRKVGLLVGVYNISEMIFSPAWGRLSDRFGRRPIILLSVGGAALIPTVFGLASSFEMAMAVRALNGVLCGSIGILKTYVAELVEKEKEAKAFSVITTCYSIGMIVGPAIGGQLSSPATWSPAADRFFDTPILRIFKREPFLLPNLVFSAFACTVWVLACLFLEESLPRAERERLRKLADLAKVQRRQDRAAALAGEGPREETKGRAQRCRAAVAQQLPFLRYPARLLRAMAAYALAVGYVIATVQNIMLVYQIPVEDNGFGLGPKTLGFLQNCAALGLLVTQLVLYPKLVQRKGYAWCVVAGLTAVLAVTLPMPLYGLMSDPEHFRGVRLIPLVIMMVVQQAAFGFCTPTTMVWINRFADGMDRGEINGWANSLAALCRALAPMLVGGLQSMGASFDGSGGRYIALYVISFLAVTIAFLLLPVLPAGAGLPAKPAESSEENSSDEEGDEENTEAGSAGPLQEGGDKAAPQEEAASAPKGGARGAAAGA